MSRMQSKEDEWVMGMYRELLSVPLQFKTVIDTIPRTNHSELWANVPLQFPLGKRYAGLIRSCIAICPREDINKANMTVAVGNVDGSTHFYRWKDNFALEMTEDSEHTIARRFLKTGAEAVGFSDKREYFVTYTKSSSTGELQ